MFETLMELIVAWNSSPHAHVIFIGRVIIAIILIALITVLFSIFKKIIRRG